MNHIGRKEDAGISTESGPFMTIVDVGVTGLAAFPSETLATTVIPFLLGCILGILIRISETYSKVVPAIISFFAFSLGNTLNFGMLIQSGLLGIFIGVFAFSLSGSSLFLLDHFAARGDGVAGAAVAMPYALAEANASFAPIAESAAAIIATSVIVASTVNIAAKQSNDD